MRSWSPLPLIFVVFDISWGVESASSETGSPKRRPLSNTDDYPNLCDRPLFCEDYLIQELTASGIFDDIKDFLDMWATDDSKTVLGAFQRLKQYFGQDPIPKTLLKTWLDDFFLPPETAFDPSYYPKDWLPEPPLLDTIKDPKLKELAVALNAEWPKLIQMIRFDGYAYQDRFSTLYLPMPFAVSGGRYREYHYWDTYYAIIGLLRSGMFKTARGILINLVALMEAHGVIPEGGRIYYQQRSGPPILIPAVNLFTKVAADSHLPTNYSIKTDHTTFGIDYLDTLEDELAFWLERRSVPVTLSDTDTRTMFQYLVDSDFPRAEEFAQDYRTSFALSNASEKVDYFSEVKSASESGWKESSRWLPLDAHGKLTDPTAGFKPIIMATSDIVPVDLNAMICYNARIMGELHAKASGNASDKYARQYLELSKDIARNIKDVMYDEESGSWFDYDLRNKVKRRSFFASSAYPLWLNCMGPGVDRTQAALKYLGYLRRNKTFRGSPMRSPLNYPGGVPVSLMADGLEWDYPNIYPPLIHVMVSALDSANHPDTKQAAFEIAQKFVVTVLETYAETGSFLRMYDATKSGRDFRGGSKSKDGYSWTVGVTLDLLYKYGDRLEARLPSKKQNYASRTTAMGLIDLFVGAMGSILVTRTLFIISS